MRQFEIDVTKIENIRLDGVDPKDHPDYCDAYVESADYLGESLDDDQLEWLNEYHPEIAQGMAFESLL